MIVQMIKNLENRMEKMQESINKDLDELKNKHTETNNTIIEIKNILLLLLLSHFSHVRPFATPWTAAYQAPPSMGFSRQEYWSGVPLPSPLLLGPPIIRRFVCLILSQRSLRLSSVLFILFTLFGFLEVIATILSSSSLIHSSGSDILLLIPSRVFFFLEYF